jgi:CO/xanthine dehydrogenase Mo-binding subunit
MQSDEVRHEGQPVAMVLGETLEAAEEGARLVEVKYQRAPFIMPATDREHTEAPGKDSGYIFDDTSFAKGKGRPLSNPDTRTSVRARPRSFRKLQPMYWACTPDGS